LKQAQLTINQTVSTPNDPSAFCKVDFRHAITISSSICSFSVNSDFASIQRKHAV
jgi:hypothetical protein